MKLCELSGVCHSRRVILVGVDGAMHVCSRFVDIIHILVLL